jgi:uncharacterized protein
MGGGGGSGHLPSGGFYIGEVAMGSSLPCSLSLAGLRAAVRPVCERHPVSRLEVFGSRAEGTALANSDVDLLVEFLPDANPGLFEMGALQLALEQQLGCRADLLSRRAVAQSKNLFRRRAMVNRNALAVLTGWTDCRRQIRR